MRVKKTLFLLVAAFVIILAGALLSIPDAPSSNEETPDPASAEGSPPTFDDYVVPAESLFTGTPAPVDLTSSPIGQTFRTRLIEGARGGPNFAGHLTVVEWGCGTMCLQFAMVDAQTGEIYPTPHGAEIGIAYQRDSRLLIVNPPRHIAQMYPNSMLVPKWLTTAYFVWNDAAHTLEFLATSSPRTVRSAVSYTQEF